MRPSSLVALPSMVGTRARLGLRVSSRCDRCTLGDLSALGAHQSRFCAHGAPSRHHAHALDCVHIDKRARMSRTCTHTTHVHRCLISISRASFRMSPHLEGGGVALQAPILGVLAWPTVAGQHVDTSWQCVHGSEPTYFTNGDSGCCAHAFSVCGIHIRFVFTSEGRDTLALTMSLATRAMDELICGPALRLWGSRLVAKPPGYFRCCI